MAGPSTIADGGIGLVLQKAMITGSSNFAAQLKVLGTNEATGNNSYSGSLNTALLKMSGALASGVTGTSTALSTAIVADSVVLSSAVVLDSTVLSSATLGRENGDSIVMSSAILADSVVLSSAVAADVIVLSSATSLNTAEADLRASGDSTVLSAAVEDDSVVLSSATSLNTTEADTRLSADNSLSALIDGASDAIWITGSKTLNIGGAGGVKMVFDDFTGTASGGPVSFEMLKAST